MGTFQAEWMFWKMEMGILEWENELGKWTGKMDMGKLTGKMNWDNGNGDIGLGRAPHQPSCIIACLQFTLSNEVHRRHPTVRPPSSWRSVYLWVICDHPFDGSNLRWNTFLKQISHSTLATDTSVAHTVFLCRSLAKKWILDCCKMWAVKYGCQKFCSF